MKKASWALTALIAGLSLWSASVRGQESDKPEVLTLKRAVTLALQNSRDLALARVQYTVARNAAGVSRAEFHPNLYTGSGAAYTSGFPSTPGGQAPSVFNLAYDQAIFNAPLRGQLRAAEDRAENLRLEVDRTRDDVIVRTATAYLELAKVRHSLELLRAERVSQQKILDLIRDRAAAGLELPIEITRGELTLARIEQHVVQLEGRYQIVSEQLRIMAGLPASQALEVEPEELPAMPEQGAGELMEAAVQNSLLVKEAENERSAREHILKGERGSYWPSVNVIGQYAVLSKFNNYTDFYKTFRRNNVTAGVEVKIPIFSAKTSANVTLARSQLTEAELALGNRRQDVRLEVQQRLQNVRELDAGREVSRLDLKLAQETLAIFQEKYNQGRATIRELEQARLEESDKWVAFLDADFARQKEQLSLLETTGQLSRVFQ
jgi:outer membrane protein